jgi:hypothetical protein
MKIRLRTACGALALLVSASGCSMAFGGAAAVVVLSAGVLASQCYDYVEVNVRDSRGVPVCDAEVVAIRGEDDEVELVPCFSAALTAGTWRIEARHGPLSATSTLVIPEERECGRSVQRIDLTLAQTPTASPTVNVARR